MYSVVVCGLLMYGCKPFQELLLVGLTLYIRRRVAKERFTISLVHPLALVINTFWGRKAICPRPQKR